MKNNVQTIEKTSKRFKLQLVLSSLGVFISIIFVITNICKNGFDHNKTICSYWALVLLGAWNTITRIRIWWNHE